MNRGRMSLFDKLLCFGLIGLVLIILAVILFNPQASWTAVGLFYGSGFVMVAIFVSVGVIRTKREFPAGDLLALSVLYYFDIQNLILLILIL